MHGGHCPRRARGRCRSPARRDTAGVARHRRARRRGGSNVGLGKNGNIKHVIYIQFDNTHFQRDNPNVPSDLEQMPNLLNFIQGNGTLLTNDHTALISHTATGILTSLTASIRTGWASRSPTASATSSPTARPGPASRSPTGRRRSSIRPGIPPRPTPTPEMINENGKIAPAPWVPYTRAGCDVGAVATANTILENTAIDIPTVFGAGSPEAAEVAANPRARRSPTSSASASTAPRARRCARQRNHGQPDLLPDEPGGYSGLQRPVRREVRRPGDQAARRR